MCLGFAGGGVQAATVLLSPKFELAAASAIFGSAGLRSRLPALNFVGALRLETTLCDAAPTVLAWVPLAQHGAPPVFSVS